MQVSLNPISTLGLHRHLSVSKQSTQYLVMKLLRDSLCVRIVGLGPLPLRRYQLSHAGKYIEVLILLMLITTCFCGNCQDVLITKVSHAISRTTRPDRLVYTHYYDVFLCWFKYGHNIYKPEFWKFCEKWRCWLHLTAVYVERVKTWLSNYHYIAFSISVQAANLDKKIRDS